MKTRLVNYREGEVDLVFLLDWHRVTVGRDYDNMIQLPNEKVSKHHALLTRIGETWVIEDLHSRNGILVNGRKTERAELKDRDTVKIGPYEFYFETHVPAHDFVPAYILDASAHSREQTLFDEGPSQKS